MGNVSKTVGFFVGLWLIGNGSVLAQAESRKEPAKPLRLQGQNPSAPAPKPQETWRPRESSGEVPAQGDGVFRGFAIQLATPLFRETVYEGRFSSVGMEVLFSLPLGPLGEGPHGFAIETGVRATYSSLSVALPSVAFSHINFGIPIRARVVFEAGDWWWEAFVGGFVEAFELDSRPAPDGGFNTTFNFLFDGGGGVSYPLFSKTARVRLIASYTNLSLGVYWDL